MDAGQSRDEQPRCRWLSERRRQQIAGAAGATIAGSCRNRRDASCPSAPYERSRRDMTSMSVRCAAVRTLEERELPAPSARGGCEQIEAALEGRAPVSRAAGTPKRNPPPSAYAQSAHSIQGAVRVPQQGSDKSRRKIGKTPRRAAGIALMFPPASAPCLSRSRN